MAGAGIWTGRGAAAVSGPIARVASGDAHGLILLADGTVQIFGWSSFSTFGVTGSLAAVTAPVVVAGLPPIKAVDTDRDYSYAVSVAGELWGWGAPDARLPEPYLNQYQLQKFVLPPSVGPVVDDVTDETT